MNINVSGPKLTASLNKQQLNIQSLKFKKCELSLYMHWVRPTEDAVQSLPFVNQGDEYFVFIEGREFFTN
jgi:hypothetical protein